MSLRERIAITARGYGILGKYCPGLVRGKALSALAGALSPFASIWFSARIIDEISGLRRLGTIALCVIAVLAANFLTSLIKSVFEKVSGEKESQMWNAFQRIFADKQMSMDYADLESAQIQHQRKQAEENLFMFGNGLGQLVWSVTGLVQSTVSVLLSISMTISLFISGSNRSAIDSPLWVGAVLFLIALGGLCNSKAVVKENAVFEEWCKGTVWFNRMFSFFGMDLHKSIERAKDIRIYEQDRIADRALADLIRKDVSGGKDIFRMSLYQSVAAVIIGIINALCYLFVVLKAVAGAFGVGSIVQYVGALNRLQQGVQELMFVLADNEVYCGHLKALYDFLDIPNGKAGGALTVGEGVMEIEFQNVSFQYPGAAGRALENVSVRFRAGKRLALVGENGSGKTTFIKLLCRLYDPTEGRILLGGIDIREYDYEKYMSRFSVVFQDFRLFAFGLGQNVAADVDFDPAGVENCLEKAGFGDRLDGMPEGVETCLYKDFDEKGVEISGGEAQKIALARALYRDAPIMILDEPTAALDPMAEAEIYEKFDQITGGKTVVYISHRLSSCRFLNDILVFDGGQIVSRGSHDSLVSTEGKYRDLWLAQSQYYQ